MLKKEMKEKEDNYLNDLKNKTGVYKSEIGDKDLII